SIQSAIVDAQENAKQTAGTSRPTAQSTIAVISSDKVGERSDEVTRSGSAEEGVATAPAPHVTPVSDLPNADVVAVEPLQFASAEPAISSASAEFASSPISARPTPDRWWRTARLVEQRHLVVASLLLLAFGAFLLPRELSISAPIAPLTMQAVPAVA